MRDKLSQALKDALKSKDAARIGALRLMQAAIKDRDIAARTAEEGGDEVVADDAAILDLFGKMIRQREESASVYEEAGRLELADRERAEITVIQEFMPTPLSEAEVEAAIAGAIAETGASGIRDMGKVMAALKAAHVGRMDFAAAGAKVKAALS